MATTITRFAYGLRSKRWAAVALRSFRPDYPQSAYLLGNTGTWITELMKVISKGQVTIPLPIRNEFGLKPGTDVEFVADAGRVILRAKRGRHDPVEAWLEESTGVSQGRTTTAKIMKLTRGED